MREGRAPRAGRRLAACAIVASFILAAGGLGASPPRYPRDLAVDPSGRWIFTANEESGSLSMLDVERGALLEELPLDPAGRPGRIAIAAAGDGSLRIAVSEPFVHSIALVRAGTEGKEATAGARRLALERRIPAGRLPAGLVFISGGRLLAACAGEGEVWELDVDSGSVLRRLPAVEGPRELVLVEEDEGGGAPRLVVAGRTQMAEIDLASGEVLSRRSPAAGRALNLGGLGVERGRILAAHQVKPSDFEIEPQMIVWGLVIANRLTSLPLSATSRPPGSAERAAAPELAAGEEWVLPLDQRHRAAGDPAALAIAYPPDRDGAPSSPLILMASSGTDRLLLAGVPEALPYSTASLTRDDAVAEVPVAGRPVAVRVAPGGTRAYVASYLDDSIAEVDLLERKLLRRLRLGPAPEATPRHEGARIFYDARRSRGGWYSCHSCHPDGGTEGHTFDTGADGGGLAKKAPSLRGVESSPPWSWLGRFASLEEQVAASLEKTMAAAGPPSPEDAGNLTLFISALPRPAPLRAGDPLGGDPERGAALFEEARCSACHRPPTFTSPGLHEVGTADAGDGLRPYNPPSLRGVRDGVRYLHDGRARSLREVLVEHNAQELHGGAHRLSAAELDDLVAYLKTL
jgi:DNA-binding beta-propeller fold protein YncE